MKISKNWLSDFISLEVKTDELCSKLTSIGLEVDSVNKACTDFKGVVIGKVVEINSHPDADKLQVTKVDIGADEPLQIVCGAKNVALNKLFPVATIGATLQGNLKIKKTKLRGVYSEGMLCSEKELGIADSSSGLMLLPKTKDFVIGKCIRDALNLDDKVIEIDLTPNRGDCLSVLGVARDLSAAYNLLFSSKSISDKADANLEASNSEQETIDIKLKDSKDCPIYMARKITNINNKAQTPLWITERLRRAGVRSLSPVVDITNYVMLCLGAPMHAFDSNKIDGGICVRRAQKDEILVLLDKKKITLETDMLVIADDKKAIALAGIMGGMNSETTIESSDIILESAWFSPLAIVGRGRKLAIQTDASYRFERGVDFEIQEKAINLATNLIIEVCGGQPAKVSIARDEDSIPKLKTIILTTKKLNKILGSSFPKDKIETILKALGFAIKAINSSSYEVITPSYRFDICIEEDLIEELIRIWGYDNITTATNNYKKSKKQSFKTLDKVNHLLISQGYSEAITYSFIDEKQAKDFAVDNSYENKVSLLNPISKDMMVMRTSLVPSLLKIAGYNDNRQQKDIKLYEFGSCYSTNKDEPQQNKLAAVITGNATPIQWGFRDRELDFFDVKGDLETIFNEVGLDNIKYQVSKKQFLHPGQAADIFYKGNYIGFIGTIHPNCLKNFNFDSKVFVFEVDSNLFTVSKPVESTGISKYPIIRRDISILLAQGYEVDLVIKEIKKASNNLVYKVELFDVYIGRNIPKGSKSLAIAIYLQDKAKTLKDEQADEVINKISIELENKFNAQLRGKNK